MDKAEKARENRARRAAERQGYRLTRSRRRDERALDFGKYYIIEPRRNRLIQEFAGLDEVETFLNGGDANKKN